MKENEINVPMESSYNDNYKQNGYYHNNRLPIPLKSNSFNQQNAYNQNLQFRKIHMFQDTLNIANRMKINIYNIEIPRNYLPINAVTQDHAMTQLSSGYMGIINQSAIAKKMREIEQLKTEFQKFCHPIIENGYIMCANTLITFQKTSMNINSFSDLKRILENKKYTTQVGMDIYYLTYGRYQSIEYHGWDNILDEYFRSKANITYTGKGVKGCFAKIANNIKSDKNRQIRAIT